jgi:hypothetical protein
MLAKKKGKMTTSKDQENFWPKRRSQRVTDNNTQTDESRLSHLSKNPMKEKNFEENFLMKKKAIVVIRPKLSTAMTKTRDQEP